MSSSADRSKSAARAPRWRRRKTCRRRRSPGGARQGGRQVRRDAAGLDLYVNPAVYGELPPGPRYDIAHIIGEITHLEALQDTRIMLVGPGRWGTTTPALGVPVTFAEIAPVTVVCELVMMHEHLIPDASLGTHFFNEMVERDLLYLALFPNQEGNRLNRTFFEERMPNRLGSCLPAMRDWSHVIHVIRASDLPGKAVPWISANTLQQHVVCYVKDTPSGGRRRGPTQRRPPRS